MHTKVPLVRHFWVLANKETLSGIVFVKEIKFSVVLSLLDKLGAILDR